MAYFLSHLVIFTLTTSENHPPAPHIWIATSQNSTLIQLLQLDWTKKKKKTLMIGTTPGGPTCQIDNPCVLMVHLNKALYKYNQKRKGEKKSSIPGNVAHQLQQRHHWALWKRLAQTSDQQTCSLILQQN